MASSSSSAASSSSSSSPSISDTPSTPPPMLEYLPSTTPRYVCAECGAHLALQVCILLLSLYMLIHRVLTRSPLSSFTNHLVQQDELISKAFSGRDGKAYLFSSSINTLLGNKEDRHLLTGMHTVCDLSCKGCTQTLGWYYWKAFESSQKYKEGKCIMEKGRLSKVNAW